MGSGNERRWLKPGFYWVELRDRQVVVAQYTNIYSWLLPGGHPGMSTQVFTVLEGPLRFPTVDVRLAAAEVAMNGGKEDTWLLRKTS